MTACEGKVTSNINNNSTTNSVSVQTSQFIVRNTESNSYITVQPCLNNTMSGLYTVSNQLLSHLFYKQWSLYIVVRNLRLSQQVLTEDTGALSSELTAELKNICLKMFRSDFKLNTNYCSRISFIGSADSASGISTGNPCRRACTPQSYDIHQGACGIR